MAELRLSPHFSLAELTRTTTGLPNEPGVAEVIALVYLCDRLLEEVRDILGGPVAVLSGYRSEAVNRAVGGNVTSQHMRGEAADVRPARQNATAAMHLVAGAVRTGVLDLDQAILYPSGFLHLSYTRERANRRELLRSLAPQGSGGPYLPWEGP